MKCCQWTIALDFLFLPLCMALWVLFASDSRYVLVCNTNHTKYDIISWTSLFFEICSIINFNYITVYFGEKITELQV